jgi:hypothetical protein
MIGRTLAKRLERLETRMIPAGEPLVYEIQFVSAVDRSITSRLQVRCEDAPGSARLAKPGRQSRFGVGA